MKSSSVLVPAVLIGSSVLLAGCAPLDSLKTSLVAKFPVLGMILGTKGQQSTIGQVAEAGKLSMMVATGKPGMCTITDTTNNSKMEYYIKGKKMKFISEGMGDMMPPGTESAATEAMETPEPSGAKKLSYFLNDGEYTYMWQEGNKSGIKMKFTAPSMSPAPTVEGQAEPEGTPPNPGTPDLDFNEIEANNNYTINCDMKELGDSEFVPPTDVTFMDYSQMNEQNYMQYMDQGKTTPGSEGRMMAPQDKKMPAGMDEMDEARVRQMMEQYTNESNTAPTDE